MKLLLSILSMLLLLAGCADPRVDGQLARAEAAMMTAPDSAAAVLDSIEPSSLRGRQAALHALLRTHANYRNYIVDTDDSLINIAVDYYTAHPDPSRLMVAYYCRGRVRDYGRRYPEAMTDALRSLDLATTLNDPFYQARAHELMGDIWHAGMNYAKAAAHYRRASKYFAAANKPENQKWSLTDVAICLYNDHKHSAALKMLDSLNKANTHDTLFTITNYETSGRIHYHKKEYERAAEIFRTIADSRFGDKLATFCYLTQIYAYQNKLPEASAAMDSALSHAEDCQGIGLQHITQAKAILLWATGHHHDAVQCQNRLLHIRDSVYETAIRRNIAQAETEFFQSKYASTSRLSKQLKQALFPIIILAMALAFACLFLKKRLKEKDASIKERMALYQKVADLNLELQTSCDKQAKTLKEQDKELSRIKECLSAPKKNNDFSAKIVGHVEYVSRICDLFFTFADDEPKLKEQLFKSVKKHIAEITNPKFIAALAGHVDSITNGFASWYRMTFNKPKEYTVLLYLLSGFSAKEVSMLLSINIQTLYSTRRSIRNRIEASDLPNKEEILAAINS